jgi:hypothetical protein
MNQDHENARADGEENASRGSGRDKSTESEPTESGHSTAESQARRNQEDESPS